MRKLVNICLFLSFSFFGQSQCDLEIFTTTEGDNVYNTAKVEDFNVKSFPRLTLNAEKIQLVGDTSSTYSIGVSYVSEYVGPLSSKDSVLIIQSDNSKIKLFLDHEVYGDYYSSSKYGILYTVHLQFSISKEQLNSLYRFGIKHLSAPSNKKALVFEPKKDLMYKFQKQLKCLYYEGFDENIKED